MPLFRGTAEAALYCAHRTSEIDLIDLSTLACFPSHGRTPMLVYVRPSNEALLRARVPGAQDHMGALPILIYRGGSASTETLPAASLLSFQACSFLSRDGG
jgi:hypothetical protein